MHNKQTSAAEVAGLDMEIVVTVEKVKQVVAALVALQEATLLLVLVVDLVVVVVL